MCFHAMKGDANEARIDKGGALVKANVIQLFEKGLEQRATHS